MADIIKSSDLDLSFIKKISETEETKSILSCFECGKCTSSCPVGEQFLLNPHQITRLAAFGVKNQILDDKILRYCLTCRTCQEYCPQNVDFIEFIRFARTLLVKQGIKYEETHDGILTLISEIQADLPYGFKIPPDVIPDGYKTLRKGKTAFFLGCLPILDVVFENYQVNLLEIAQNGIKVLTEVLGQSPVVIENAKCCGHDALWKGHFDTFKKLAEHNVKEINELGIETIITACAECYRTLKVDYPKYIDNVNFSTIHLSELIADKIKSNQLKFTESYDVELTYHDPCRLGRHMNVYSPPREIFKSMEENGVIFTEMEKNRENSTCCGVSCFINCNDLSKALQKDRLVEAKGIADLLITTCPKCYIHYSCMLHEKKEKPLEEIQLKITDLTNLLAIMIGVATDKQKKDKDKYIKKKVKEKKPLKPISA
ncbi:MAG: (Fe-S)-binding protein [Promethearchaeota archaeon]